tara:strand:+ start:132 stop:584 length:453 start_codon:yes stop_codon:yes gene_type:complete
MKKSDFKKQIKPIVKEVIHEVILESGIISKIVQEAMVGVKSAEIVLGGNRNRGETTRIGNTKPSELREERKSLSPDEESVKRYNKQLEARRKLLDSIGRDKVKGVDIFEGTTPIADNGPNMYGPLKDVEANDSGVDLSSLPGVKKWRKLF